MNIHFYALRQKFIDTKDDVPEQAKQVMYYSLSIGHHVGIIDCLKSVLTCPKEEYKIWIGQLAEGEAKRKMLGLLRFGEIMIDSSHVSLLAHAFATLLDNPEALYGDWTTKMMSLLQEIQQEPAIYLLVRQQHV